MSGIKYSTPNLSSLELVGPDTFHVASFSRAVLSCMNMLERKGREWGDRKMGDRWKEENRDGRDDRGRGGLGWRRVGGRTKQTTMLLGRGRIDERRLVYDCLHSTYPTVGRCALPMI